MNFERDLQLAFQDLAEQDPLYQPTPFWAEASAKIAHSVLTRGIERFRANPLCLGFFVPNYGSPTSPIPPEEQALLLAEFQARNPQNKKGTLALEQFFSGHSAALADFRVLKAADDPHYLPSLDSFSEATAGQPIEQHEFEGRRYSRSALNYLLGLAMLKRHLQRPLADRSTPLRVLEIGGGFGTLGEILSHSGLTDWQYIDVDIPPTGTIAEWYLRCVLGDNRVRGYAQTRQEKSIPLSSLPPAAVLMPWQLPKLQGSIDIFVNFISFQEMEPAVVQNYLQHVTRLGSRWILLRNLREGKQKRTQASPLGVDTPIQGDAYLNMLPAYRLVERGTFPFGYRTVDGFHSELLLLKREEP